jgi:hypothetical protein
MIRTAPCPMVTAGRILVLCTQLKCPVIGPLPPGNKTADRPVVCVIAEEVESGRAERVRFSEECAELQERTEELRAELADTQARLLVVSRSPGRDTRAGCGVSCVPS